MIIYFQNGFDDVTLDVEFDYQPYEAMTRDYPGCPEAVDIYSVILEDTGSEVCLLPDAEVEVEEKILDNIHEGE